MNYITKALLMGVLFSFIELDIKVKCGCQAGLCAMGLLPFGEAGRALPIIHHSSFILPFPSLYKVITFIFIFQQPLADAQMCRYAQYLIAL
jgi:hypothetical protein